MATKTVTGTHVNFVKVSTLKDFDDITTKVAGTIYFIVDAQKIYLDDVMYGFNESDIADRFLELTGGKMSGDIDMNEHKINNVRHLHFDNGASIYQETQEGGLMFHSTEDGKGVLTITDQGSVHFDTSEILGIPEPTVSTSPISKGYLDTNVINKKGVKGGFASLNEDGLIPSGQLPSYVDDIKDFNTSKSFPNTGEASKIYLALDTGDLWRWAGDRYVRISDGSGVLVLGTTSSTAYRGDRGQTAYSHSLVTSGNPHGVTKNDVKLGNVWNFDIATPAEAKAGDSEERYMTPKTTKLAIEELSPILSWEVK